MKPALLTEFTVINKSTGLRQVTGQTPHHLIDPVFIEALLRISAYLPEWEVELVNDSETWPDYVAAIVSLPVRHICGVMLKKVGMCKFMSDWIEVAIKGLDVTLCPSMDVNPFANDGQLTHTQIGIALQMGKKQSNEY